MTYEEAMRAARLRAELSQRQLAEETLVKPSTLSKYENGFCQPGFYFAEDAAYVLGISIDEYLGFEHKPRSEYRTPDQHRKAAGLTIEELAALAGVSKNAVQSVEHCYHEPSVSVVIKLARALGLGIDDYMGV